MEQEIKDIIEKNLPIQVGTILKEKLIEADKNKDLVNKLTIENNRLSDTITKITERMISLEALQNSQLANDKKAQELATKELELKYIILQHDLKASNILNSNLLELSRIVFKNKTLVYQEFGSENFSKPSDYNSASTTSSNKTTRVEVD